MQDERCIRTYMYSMSKGGQTMAHIVLPDDMLVEDAARSTSEEVSELLLVEEEYAVLESFKEAVAKLLS